jgi:nitrogen regulatory protein P-II 1
LFKTLLLKTLKQIKQDLKSFFCFKVFKSKIINQFIKKPFMKKIEAIIRKSKFDEVKTALHQIEVNFFTYWDVTGVGNEKEGHVYRGITYNTSDIQRRFISIVVSDPFLERTVETILKTAYTGMVGDGKIFISEIQETYRIRTKENGSDAVN